MLHSLVLYYRNVNNQLAAEFMRLTADGLIDRVFAHYSDCSCDGDRAYSSQNGAPHRERKSKIQNLKEDWPGNNKASAIIPEFVERVSLKSCKLLTSLLSDFYVQAPRIW